MKKKKKLQILLPLLGAVLVSALVSGAVVMAQGGTTVLGKAVEFLSLIKELNSMPASSEESLGAFISPGSHMTDLAVANDLTVGSQLSVTATSTFSGYVSGVDYVEYRGLVDSTSTISYICADDGQRLLIKSARLVIPASGSGAGADAKADRKIDISVASNQYSSSTNVLASAAYTTSTSRQYLSYTSDYHGIGSTSTMITATNFILTANQCLTAVVNKAASSTISTNTDGVFEVGFKKLE